VTGLSERGFAVIGAAATAAVATSVVLQVVADVHQPTPVGRLSGGAAVDITTGAAWLAGGWVAWRRRPANRIGALMMSVGAAILLPWILAAGGSLGFTLAALLDDLAPALGAHVFLAFPTGRLSRWPERVVVAVAYLDATIVLAAEVLVRDYAAACGQCPENLLLVDADASVAGAIVTVARVGALGVAVSLVVILALRWRTATPPARRVLAPVLWTSVAVAVLFAVSYTVDEPAAGSDIDRVSSAATAAIPLAFLVGLLRTRLHRTAVGDLVVELGTPHSPARLRDVLADALGDSSLELAFWLPDAGRYVDVDGRPVSLSAGTGRAVSVIEHDGVRLAALSYDSSLLEDPDLVEGVGAAARLALENSRLQAELRAQLLLVRDSRARIVAAGDAERRRIERNLHDGAQQHLLAIRLALRFARRSTGPAEVDARLAEIDAELAGALDELRALARGLHPPILTEQGLGPALETLIRRAAIPVELTTVPAGRMPEPVETAVYYVASEGLANIAKHAGASRARIGIAQLDGRAVVEVADDGRGGANASGSGLRGLRDRVEALDGSLTVVSTPGAGTTLRAELPCA
jgi:signal transduction histidine kinase